MISPETLYAAFVDAGVDFITGVPDSVLKEFCAYVDAVLPPERHVIAVNEGTAVGLAIGMHLATGRTPMVYLQNSGLGNAINPLLSMVDRQVYAIPMVLLVGWRGAPGVEDEPQHAKQGPVTTELLTAMDIPWRELTADTQAAERAAAWSVEESGRRSGPVALLVRPGMFRCSDLQCGSSHGAASGLSRAEAIELVTRTLEVGPSVGGLFVASTGMIGRELFDQRERLMQRHDRDFLSIGAMGHASQMALALAMASPGRHVTCFDGDGAALMHLGGMATIGAAAVGQLLHVVLNNGMHDSVGGQPTVGFRISFTGIARACGYDAVEGPVATADELTAAVSRLAETPGRRFIEVRVRGGSRSGLGRPSLRPADSKQSFMALLHGDAVEQRQS